MTYCTIIEPLNILLIWTKQHKWDFKKNELCHYFYLTCPLFVLLIDSLIFQFKLSLNPNSQTCTNKLQHFRFPSPKNCMHPRHPWCPQNAPWMNPSDVCCQCPWHPRNAPQMCAIDTPWMCAVDVPRTHAIDMPQTCAIDTLDFFIKSSLSDVLELHLWDMV